MFALLIHFSEGGNGHEHFAADFEVGGDSGFLQLVQRNGKRDGPDRAHIQSDVFADRPVATGDTANQFATLVMQGQGHAVELQLADIVDVLTTAQFAHAAFPVAQFVLTVGVVERQHGRGVWRFEEPFAGLAPDPLGGRVGRDQVGMFGFDFLQLNHELVEFGIHDFGIVEYVVEVFVVADCFAQCFDLFFDPLWRVGHN